MGQARRVTLYILPISSSERAFVAVEQAETHSENV